MSSYDEDFDVILNLVRGDRAKAETFMRGLSVASTALGAAEAVNLVLQVHWLVWRGEELETELERRVERAMWPRTAVGVDDLGEGPLAHLRVDIRTRSGVLTAGTPVRVLDRRSEDEVLVLVLDREQTVVPVSEAALVSFEYDPSPTEGKTNPAWGTSRELLPDGTYICEDASGAWYFDPATGQTDIIAQRGGTEWYNPKYRLSYVESRLRDGTPFADWDVRGQREWVANAVERGWARPDGAPNPREEHRRERPQAKRASTGREKS